MERRPPRVMTVLTFYEGQHLSALVVDVEDPGRLFEADRLQVTQERMHGWRPRPCLAANRLSASGDRPRSTRRQVGLVGVRHPLILAHRSRRSGCDDGLVRSRVPRLLVSCVVLGVGVGMLLLAALGSDGYSTFINGASLALDVPFILVNCAVGVVLVAMAWRRGLTPGLGTVVQPVLVGAVVSAILASVAVQEIMWVRITLLLVAFPVLAVGVAGYLGSGTGAGPTEAAALAFDPPVPFRWSYTVVQGGGALGGWLMGAAVGPGTLLVIGLLGPAVDLLFRSAPALDVGVVRREAGA